MVREVVQFFNFYAFMLNMVWIGLGFILVSLDSFINQTVSKGSIGE